MGMFEDIFPVIEGYLKDVDLNATKSRTFPFRKRSEHIKRVFMWAERLLDNAMPVDRDAVLMAALFHDTGYAISIDGSRHAENSVIVFKRYAEENGIDPKQAGFIESLIRRHSDKKELHKAETPMELVLLMEADMLDETGAMSIIWDSMAEGAEAVQSFGKTYERLNERAVKLLGGNPMRTAKAKAYWDEKQELVREFLRQLGHDLF